MLGRSGSLPHKILGGGCILVLNDPQCIGLKRSNKGQGSEVKGVASPGEQVSDLLTLCCLCGIVVRKT